MHRFRKKSDAKRSPYLQQQSEPLPPPPQSLLGVLPELPPESDFRTSLILPDLSRRFSVLRSSSGAILSVDALRLKFAEQRARGDQVQVTEEEEDMLFETLGLRNRGAAPSKSQENVSEGAGSGRRYSNNLFGSGKLRDHTYIRNARGSSRAQSAASSDAQYEENVRSAPLSAPTPYGEQPTFAKSAFKRASLALEHAIHEMEEEDAPEDEVVLPRSAPIVRSSIEHRLSPEPPGMAISSDKQLRKDLEERRASPVPARTLPGYIPGMPRPMTPRDTDSDDQRSYSTTPRATSPTNFTFPNRNESASPTFSSSVMSSYARREAAGSVRHSPAPTSSYSSTPLFLQRSPNGRHTPDDSRMDIAIDFDQSLNASILGRRRAASPLSSSYSTSMGSRPGTPSNSAAWPQPPSSPPQPRRGHSRNASWFTDETTSDAHPTIDQVNVPLRSLKSPALPDSPLIDRGHAVMDSISSSQYSSDKRPASPMSGLELGAANPYTRVIRTPTPTEGPSRSPVFSNGGSPRSQRSSRQNGSIHNYNYSSFNNPLVFSPPASSSRSSLESTGSSYHSWEGDRNDNLSTLFNDSDAQPSWYDVSVSDQTSSITSAGFVEEEAEAILQAIGLKRADFMVIQEKLVEFANTKVASSETTPQRSQSLRRRRPSTSQSNYSFNGRIASPPPQTPSSPSNAVFPTVNTEPPRKDDGDSPEDPSPTTRKNRAIADLLFGSEEPEVQILPSTYEEEAQSPSLQTEPDPSIPPPSNLPIPYTQTRNPSTPKLPQTAEEEAELEREVERKTTAAMLALKGSASKSNLNLSDSNGNTSRKRISPNQISTPTFVSSSTSVDAIPLRSPVVPTSTSTSGSSKMSRFKKLQGTLRRPKQLPTGEEVTPFPIDFRSQDGSQSITYTPEPSTIITSSAVEPRFKVAVQSPPASAGPGLKGFMARFRSKSRTIDPSPQVVSRHSPHSFNASTPDLGHSKTPRAKSVPLTSEPSSSQTIRGAGRSSPMTPRGSSPSDAPQLAAIRQFFDLGHEIGLDRDQLDSLVRSASTSSKATALSGLTRNKSKSLSRNNSMAQALSRNNSVTLGQATTLKRNNSSVVFNQPEGHVDSLAPSRRGQSSAHHGASLTPQRSMRKAPPEFIRRPPREREHDHDQDAEDLARQTIVRRTIIMPSDLRASGFDLNAIMPKNASHRRRQSVTSNSSRSVQERAPTPPPSRSVKRQSRDVPPPLPHQETASPTSEGRLQVPGMEPSNSNYDSLYEMYTGDGRPSPAHEATPALEVIELANGRTIWQIVNGLRDDDAESIYTGRASMASEYEEDEMQIYVKERSGSASSNQRKSVKASRPETKVFYSSPAHIGRLIEGLSQGMDAGSFNFRGNNPAAAHSTTSSMSSDPAWTVEERLDHMLGSMRVT